MRYIFLILLFIVCDFVAVAQTPSEKLFSKYGNRKGVELFVTSQPPVKDTIRNTMVSTVVTELTVNAEAEDNEKGKSKVYDQVKKDCMKFFKSKDYVVIQKDKDAEESFTVYKYAKKGIVEMCVLTIDDDKLTVESTKMTGLPQESIDNIKISVNRVKM